MRAVPTVDDVMFLEGRERFAELLDAVAERGWRAEYQEEQPYYGPYYVIAPHGQFVGQGMGRADSLDLALSAAVAAQVALGPTSKVNITPKRVEKLGIKYEAFLNEARRLLGKDHPLMTPIYNLHDELMGLWGDTLAGGRNDGS